MSYMPRLLLDYAPRLGGREPAVVAARDRACVSPATEGKLTRSCPVRARRPHVAWQMRARCRSYSAAQGGSFVPPCRGVFDGIPLPQAGPTAGSRSLRERLVPHVRVSPAQRPLVWRTSRRRQPVRSVGTPPTDVPDPPLTREAPSDRCIGGVGTSAAPKLARHRRQLRGRRLLPASRHPRSPDPDRYLPLIGCVGGESRSSPPTPRERRPTLRLRPRR